MKCSISKLKTTTIIDDVFNVTVPTSTGEINIRSNHAEYYGVTVTGNVLVIKNDQTKQTFGIDSGICMVKDNEILIIQ
ncbi:MAG: hypothetical protein R3B60_04760 [Candidatus Paceibacterota bacterium]